MESPGGGYGVSRFDVRFLASFPVSFGLVGFALLIRALSVVHLSIESALSMILIKFLLAWEFLVV